jgi:hypothetical protein
MSRVSTPSKPAAAPTTNTAANTTQVPHEKIAMRAYEKWCQRGRPHGTTMQDWLEAERELKTETGKGGKR